MNILFDPGQNKWGHREAGKSFVWGKSRALLPRLPLTSGTVLFPANVHGKKVGPLVGMLTSRKGATFAGNRTTFHRIHRALGNRGGIVFVFTPEGVKRNGINAFILNENRRRWIRTQLPYPDVVYNRIPFRDDEHTPIVRSLLEHLKSLGISYFNSGFLDKWEMYETLRKDPALAAHLPDTRQASKENMKNMLNVWEALYAKPYAGQKGDGMYLVTHGKGGTFIYRSHKKTIPSLSFNRVWERLKPAFEKTPYLLQQKIDLMYHHGRPYDFRLMVQKVNGKWQSTGCGARLAGKGSITTHVPKGGELLALDQLRPPADLEILKAISKRAAKQLEEHFTPLYELSFDIGRDQDGHYWLFEANAKPMMFDEPGIEQKRMKRLIHIFYELGGF